MVLGVSISRAMATAALAAAALATPPVPSGTLYGLFHNAGDPNTCPLIAIDVATGNNVTINPAVPACAAVTTTWPSYSTLGQPGYLLVAITSAATVSSIDLKTGATTSLGQLPTNDTLIGLAHLQASNETFVVTQYALWNATAINAAPVLIKSFNGPSEALVTVAQSGGSGDAPRIFIADQNSASIVVIDTGDLGAAPTVLDGVSGGAGDLAYDSPSDRLILAQGYALYAMPSDGSAKAARIGSLQDGPGYPKVNAATTKGFWIFFDFANVHVVDVTDSGATQLAKWPFSKAPLIVGFPQWVA